MIDYENTIVMEDGDELEDDLDDAPDGDDEDLDDEDADDDEDDDNLDDDDDE